MVGAGSAGHWGCRVTDTQSSCPQGQSKETNKTDQQVITVVTGTMKTTSCEVNSRIGKGEDQRKGRRMVGEGPPGQDQEIPQLKGDPKSGQEWNEAHIGMKKSTRQKSRTAIQAGVGMSTAPGESLKSLKEKFTIHVPVCVVVAVVRVGWGTECVLSGHWQHSKPRSPSASLTEHLAERKPSHQTRNVVPANLIPSCFWWKCRICMDMLIPAGEPVPTGPVLSLPEWDLPSLCEDSPCKPKALPGTLPLGLPRSFPNWLSSRCSRAKWRTHPCLFSLALFQAQSFCNLSFLPQASTMSCVPRLNLIKLISQIRISEHFQNGKFPFTVFNFSWLYFQCSGSLLLRMNHWACRIVNQNLGGFFFFNWHINLNSKILEIF